jgi:tripartite-type tricarboxylate transporter receptor subunit TctC
VLAQALGDETVLYDHAALNWLGSVSSLPVVCVTRTAAGYVSIDELIDGPEVPVGATAPGSIPFDSAVAINGALGTNFNVITGYEGSSEILLAIERGELDGLCIALIPAMLEWIQTGFAVPLVVMGEVPAGQDEWEAALDGVPRASDLAEGAQAQELLTAVQGPNSMVYAYAVHPDTPADRVAALQAAFAAMLASPDFAGVMADQGRIFAPKTAGEVQSLVESILALSPETAQLLRDLREGN